jgi:hypothetical protein
MPECTEQKRKRDESRVYEVTRSGYQGRETQSETETARRRNERMCARGVLAALTRNCEAGDRLEVIFSQRNCQPHSKEKYLSVPNENTLKHQPK